MGIPFSALFFVPFCALALGLGIGGPWPWAASGCAAAVGLVLDVRGGTLERPSQHC